MSTKIKLTVDRRPDLELFHRGIVHTRLLCPVEFVTLAGTIIHRPAVIDTGAPVTLVPSDIWQQVRTQQFEEARIGGFVGRKECSIAVRVGILSLSLLDPHGDAQRLIVRAFLAETTDVPLILGFQDCLERATMHVSCHRKEAWLDFD